MRTHIIFSIVLVVLLAACGGDDAGNQTGKVRKLGGPTPPPTSTASGSAQKSGGPAVPATSHLSITEAKNRELVKKLAQNLKRARTSDDRAEVLSNITRFGKPGKPLLEDVKACWKDKDPFVREETLKAVAAINPKGCKMFLETGLKDDEESVRMAAVSAWMSVPIKDLTPLLLHLQDELETSVQMAIGLAVKELGSELHVDAAVNALGDVSVAAARPLIEFLIKQKAVQHVDILAAFLGRSDPTVRSTAARGLGEMGVKTRPVLQALVDGLSDDDERVRKSSFKSLKTLTKQDFGYDPEATEEEHAKAVEAWMKWVKSSG